MKYLVLISIVFIFVFLIFGITINTTFSFLISQSILGIFSSIKLNKGFYLQDIRVFFILSFTLYSSFLPFSSVFGFIQGFDSHLPQTTFLYGIALFAFNSYTLFKNRKWVSFSEIEYKSKGFLIPILWLFSLVLYSIYYMRSAGVPIFSFGDKMISRTELGENVSQLWVVLSFVIIAVSNFLIYNLSKMNLKLRLLLIIVLIIYFGFQLSLGNRREIAGILFFSISFFLSFFKKKIDLKLTVILLFLFIGSFAITLLRDEQTRTLDTSTKVEVALRANEFIFPMQTTYYILKDDWGYRYGSTYFFLPFQVMIPRIIYTNKPSTLGAEFTAKTFGKDYQGYAYTPVSEAYLNFGIIGPFMVFFLLAVFLDYIIRSNSKSGKLNFVYFLFYGLIFDLCRGDFASIFYAVVVMYFFGYRFVYYLSKFKLKFG